ncbi:MAG: carbohydrate kinase [Arenicella sp.]|nr:carbohydrate kinase [Arenicella sp.]
MKPVVCFGELIIDFLNTSSEQGDLLTLNDYRQFPGGAPANAAVAVAKLGGNALFAGQVGDDQFGHFLESSLQAFKVNTQFLHKHPVAKTALAFVTLDQQNDRSFSFYRDQTADLLFDQSQVDDGWFANHPIVHFCSNTLTQTAIADCTAYVVNQALQHSATLSFDVNLRHNLWPEKQADAEVVNKLVSRAHIVKFSFDEFNYLAGQNVDQYLDYCFSGNCQLLLITNGEKDICYYTKAASGVVPVSRVKVVDTTAGGDGFIGGMLFSMAHFERQSELIDDIKTLESIIKFSAHCGASAVTKKGAFPALPKFSEVAGLIQQTDPELFEFIKPFAQNR